MKVKATLFRPSGTVWYRRQGRGEGRTPTGVGGWEGGGVLGWRDAIEKH